MDIQFESKKTKTNNLKIVLLFIVLIIITIFVFRYYLSPLLNKNKIAFLDKEREEIFKLVQEVFDDQNKNCSKVLPKIENYLKYKQDDLRMLELYGICLFRDKKYEEAKNVFQKILTFDSNYQSAKNYLDLINQVLNYGVKIIDQKTDSLNKEFVESQIGFSLDPQKYEFKEALRLSKDKDTKFVFSAVYISKQKYNFVINDIADILKKTNLKYEIDKDRLKDKGIYYSVKIPDSDTNNPSITIDISILNSNPVVVSIFFYKR